MDIPFLQLVDSWHELQDELHTAFRRVMDGGWYILGPEVETFERAFADYCGAAHCIGCGSGLDALELIMESFGIGSGDEVIVPANTYIASWLGVSRLGAVPVPVEPQPLTRNIDPSHIKAAITQKTRAIMAVHLYGLCADMVSLRSIADEYGLKLIEDAAQAHGAELDGVRAGALSDAAAFSFYPSKNLGAYGDAGAVVTSDPAVAEKVMLLRNYGSPQKYINTTPGRNSRLDPLQAAFLGVRLPYLDVWNKRRRTLAALYHELLEQVPGIRRPTEPEGYKHVWHVYAIEVEKRAFVIAQLKKKGIGSLVHYPIPPHLSPAYRYLGYGRGDYPISEQLAQTILSLPLSPHHDSEAIHRVCDVLAGILR